MDPNKESQGAAQDKERFEKYGTRVGRRSGPMTIEEYGKFKPVEGAAPEAVGMSKPPDEPSAQQIEGTKEAQQTVMAQESGGRLTEVPASNRPSSIRGAVKRFVGSFEEKVGTMVGSPGLLRAGEHLRTEGEVESHASHGER